MHKLPIRVVSMWSGCVQTTANLLHATGTTSDITHIAEYKNYTPAHKSLSYTLQMPLSYPQVVGAFAHVINRVVLAVIPTIHTPYIYDKKLLLNKYIIGGRQS